MKSKYVLSIFNVMLVFSLLIGTTSIVNAAAQTPATSDDSLLFPEDDYTEETITVMTSEGEEVEVIYHLYQNLTYVADPVDADYQSMDVKVPVSIDGEEIDATEAPILFVINVNNYFSSNNAEGGAGFGMPGGELSEEELEAMGTPPGEGEMEERLEGEHPEGEEGEAPPEGEAPEEGERPEGEMPEGEMPEGQEGGNPGGMGGFGGGMGGVNEDNLALAAGYVVVSPGVRGSDNQAEDGTYFGKAPAAIVDLKAAVRYIRYNDETMPGNAEWIIASGEGAGGNLSALLAASGNSDLYDDYLEELGAAEADDDIYASVNSSAVTDLEHADMAYEWQFGSAEMKEGSVDQDLSEELAAAFSDYLDTLALDAGSYGTLSVDNYADYLLETYLIPAASDSLLSLEDEQLEAYLEMNDWITWDGTTAEFTFEDYVKNSGRSKDLPAFDDFELSSVENMLFGDETTEANHFTDFSLQQADDDETATLDEDLQTIVNMMNPMYFITEGEGDCAEYWRISQSSRDSATPIAVVTNLAISLENQGKDVTTLFNWDSGRGAGQGTENLITWVAEITGYDQ